MSAVTIAIAALTVLCIVVDYLARRTNRPNRGGR